MACRKAPKLLIGIVITGHCQCRKPLGTNVPELETGQVKHAHPLLEGPSPAEKFLLSNLRSFQ